MPNHDIDPFPRVRGRSASSGWRACAAAAAAVGAVALVPGTALASGGSTAPSQNAEQQQTTQDHASGGAAAQPPKKHKKHKRSRKASHHIKLPAELKKIAMCESGDNPRAVSPSGKYRGKYQFDMETWRSVGGHGDPAKAPEWYQDKLALKLYRERGTAPWPNCA